MINYLIEISLILWNLGTAWGQARYFKAHEADGKTINHTLWAIAYAVVVVVVVSLYYSWPTSFSWLWYNAIILVDAVLVRIVFFDPVLNVFRGKPFFYLNPQGKIVIDRLKYKFWMPVYIFCSLLLLAYQPLL